MLPLLLPLVGLVPALVHSAPAKTFETKCADLANTVTTSTNHSLTVNIAEYLPTNYTIDHRAEGMNETCFGFTSEAPPLPANVCRLALNVKTTNASETIMELWLPETWNGRFLSTGNGGLAGCIQYPELAYGLSYGFVSMGTNAGHNGTSGGAFYHQPEVLEDFVWRSVYAGTVIGKSLTETFYGKEACSSMKSYYIGCSSGGRQGWKAVQQNPELFDGVLAGAPATNFLGHGAFMAEVLRRLGWNVNTTLVSLEQWASIHQEVLNQCDHLDGAVDGIIEDTRACKFDISPLLCSTNSTTGCLNDTQADAATSIFEPVVYEGKELHPGQAHSGEVGLITGIYTYAPTWVAEFFKYIIKEDLTIDPEAITLKDAADGIALNPFNIQTWDGDISAFRNRGGKVLHYHGQADELLSVLNSDEYYTRVQSSLNASVAELDEFYRYFRISGMGHCSGGVGTNMLGQLGGTSAGDDPEDNLLMRIVDWVENGNAPETVRGTKFVNDTEALGIAFKRKHCKFPLTNVYKGTGNGTDEEGWECVESLA